MFINLDIQTIINWIIPTLLIIGGTTLGVVFDKMIMAAIHKLSQSSKWLDEEIISNSIPHKLIIFWFTLGGIYTALLRLPFDEKVFMLFQKVLMITFMISITTIAAHISTRLVRMFTTKNQGAFPVTSIFLNLTKVSVFTVGALMILNSIGISITPILTALGVGGLAVALALQETLSNLFSGLQIILSKQLQPGNYIKLNSGEEGYVEDINWRNTTIRNLPNNMIVIPNSKISSTILTNFNLPQKEMAVLVQVGVDYKSDLEKVEKITTEVAKKTLQEVPGGVAEFEPFIRYHTFSDFSINFTVILRAREFTDKFLVKHEFIKNLHERYKKEGIEIPFPTRTVLNKP